MIRAYTEKQRSEWRLELDKVGRTQLAGHEGRYTILGLNRGQHTTDQTMLVIKKEGEGRGA